MAESLPILLEDASLAVYTASEGGVAGEEIFSGLCLSGVSLAMPEAGEPLLAEGLANRVPVRGAGLYRLEVENLVAPDPALLVKVASVPEGVPLVAVVTFYVEEGDFWVKWTLTGAGFSSSQVAPGEGRLMTGKISIAATRLFQCSASGEGDVTARRFGEVWWTDGRERLLAYRWDLDDGSLERLDPTETRLVLGDGGAADWEISVGGDVALEVEGGELRAKAVQGRWTGASGERCEVLVGRERVFAVGRDGTLYCTGLNEEGSFVAAAQADELVALDGATVVAGFSMDGARAAAVAEVASF